MTRLINTNPIFMLAAVAALSAGVNSSMAIAASQQETDVNAEPESRASATFLLVMDDLATMPADAVEMDGNAVLYLAPDSGWRDADADRVLALLRTAASVRAPVNRRGSQPMIKLADGQQFPGWPVSESSDSDELRWDHDWLGSIVVPVDRVHQVQFDPSVEPPDAGVNDVIQLRNGDRMEGFILGLGDPLVIEVGSGDKIEAISLERQRVAAVGLVTPRSSSDEVRAWFGDRTVVDLSSVRIGDDGYVRLETAWREPNGSPLQMRISTLDAVLFQPQRLRSLATIEPASIDGPQTRYIIPQPEVLDLTAPMDLSTIMYRGPLTVHYPLPPGASRFNAQAVLPEQAREYGDFSLEVAVDGQLLQQGTLNAAQPVMPINIPLEGAELTIRMSPGLHGPVQDQLHLVRPMILLNSR